MHGPWLNILVALFHFDMHGFSRKASANTLDFVLLPCHCLLWWLIVSNLRIALANLTSRLHMTSKGVLNMRISGWLSSCTTLGWVCCFSVLPSMISSQICFFYRFGDWNKAIQYALRIWFLPNTQNNELCWLKKLLIISNVLFRLYMSSAKPKLSKSRLELGELSKIHSLA